ncbi:MAG TPA: L-threonylcarbamoyladenylate synthase [Pyrinomonadaceae bacterium]|jgi:L-threonylcarbamoyladenylate synthase|nr:L-threonylcarbamoyladenylate synthase [Pyrinomonadaceae bacterium]
MNDERSPTRTPILAEGGEARARARDAVGRGGVVGFRTDTFYGLGANPLDQAAVRAVNELKGREGKPVLVVLSDAEQAARLVAAQTDSFRALAARFWAGALTLVAEAGGDVPAELTAGTGTVGVRLPADVAVREFVRACGGALTATSANLAGEPPARSARDVAAAFPSGLALIVDGGATRASAPSTVVDVTGGAARLIREGAIPWREIEAALADLK